MSFVDQTRSWARRQGAPITVGLTASFAVAFVLAWFTYGRSGMLLLLVPGAGLHPWGFLTYPWAYSGNGNSVIFDILLLAWFFSVGASLEREVGSQRYAIVFSILTVLPAVLIFVGGLALGMAVPLLSPYLPIAGLTVAWGVHNRGATCRLYGVLPLSGLVIAILTVVMVLFGYGTGAPVLGILACGHLLFAYLFAMNKVPGLPYSRPVYQYKPSKEKQKRDAAYFDEVKAREQDRQERERLKKLFENSGLDE